MASKVKAGEAFVEATLQDGKLRRGLKAMGGFAKSAGMAIGRGLAVGVSVGIAAGAVLIRGAIEKAADLQITKTAFETMLGSADAATDLIDRLRKLGASTPFESKDLLDSTKVLLNFGASADEAYDSIKMLSDIAAGDAQKLGSLALVFGQIRSAGKLTGGDLLQLINVGFNPLLSISEKTGESMSDLRDRMSKGLVTFEEVRDAFKEATSEGGRFFQMNEKMSKTVAGQWSTMKDNWETLMTTMGTAMLPFVQKVFDYLGNITDGFNITTESIGDVWSRFLESLLMQLEASGHAIDHWVLRQTAALRKGMAAGFDNIPGMGGFADRLRRAAEMDEAEADKRAAKMVEIEREFDKKFLRPQMPTPATPAAVTPEPTSKLSPVAGIPDISNHQWRQTVASVQSQGTFSGAFAGGMDFLTQRKEDTQIKLQREANEILESIDDKINGDGPVFQ